MNRRNWLKTAAGILVAPAIVRAESIMRVRPIIVPVPKPLMRVSMVTCAPVGTELMFSALVRSFPGLNMPMGPIERVTGTGIVDSTGRVTIEIPERFGRTVSISHAQAYPPDFGGTNYVPRSSSDDAYPIVRDGTLIGDVW